MQEYLKREKIDDFLTFTSKFGIILNVFNSDEKEERFVMIVQYNGFIPNRLLLL